MGGQKDGAGAFVEDVGHGFLGSLSAGVHPESEAGELAKHDVFKMGPSGGDGLLGAITVAGEGGVFAGIEDDEVEAERL
jgi:hypothetical protein